MQAFQICGFSKSGKTTTTKELVKRLSGAGYQTASIKDIHFKDFQIDQPDKNTYIHKEAGADPVVARGLTETDFLYNHKMEFLDIRSRIECDWLVVEGFRDFPLPNIVCGKTHKEVDDHLDRRTFAISGVISNDLKEYKGIPVFNPMIGAQMDLLYERVIEKVFPMLPYVDDDCCGQCGLTCTKMVDAIIQGEKEYSDCKIRSNIVTLKIGNKEIPMVPFVQKVLKNNVLSMATELNGYQKGKKIEIMIKED